MLALRVIPLFPFLALVAGVHSVRGESIYFNDFHEASGTKYPEWTSSVVAFNSTQPPRNGTLPAPVVTNTESPNHALHFLGEFGGPPIGQPGAPGWNRTRVEQTVTLTLSNLPPHAALRVTFDLLILKSWDGNSPAYGPDRWSVGLQGKPALLETTFSNNPKVAAEGSNQDFPKLHSLPQTGAQTIGTLGYDNFFKDSVYRMNIVFEHAATELRLDFRSSLFEGKGLADESWGLANVMVETVAPPAPNRPQ
jgi:hypothetical protein